MADDNDGKTTQANPRGCFSRLLVLFLLLCAAGFGLALYFMAQPQDLSDLRVASPDTRPTLRRDLKLILKTSLERSRPVTITEGEINQWLSGVLESKQRGLFADKVTLEGVWVRLEDGRAEVVMERKVLGKPFTVSMYLQIQQSEGSDGTKTVHFHGGPFNEFLPFPKCGGRFGRLPVPQGFLHLVKPAFTNLAEVFPEEIRLAFEDMAVIKIQDGHLTLDPRIPEPVATTPP